MKYEELEEKVCNFDMYLKQTMDILKDAYRWKVMAQDCDDIQMKNKYMQISNTLYNLFMEEHNNIGKMFNGEMD